ncbi:MAG: hypothetical protein PVG22_18630 [Chromatiales bacterium]|jgi:hypothetical protein
MKSHRSSIPARIALIAAVAGLLSACVSSPYRYEPDLYHSQHSVYYDYWYYPQIDSYYDPRARIYIYHEHDHWIRARTLPPRMRTHLGHHVTVRSPHDRPYEEHHRHRQQYQPERYREREHDHRGDESWIGAPHQQSPQRDRDDRHRESRYRDRDGNDRRYEPERGTVSVPPYSREPDVKYPYTRSNDTKRHREPSASTTPFKQGDKWRQPVDQRGKSHEQDRRGADRRNNERKLDHGRSGSSTGQAGPYRVPDSRGQHPEKSPQTAPGQRQPPTRTVPTKQDDKRHQRENRKEDTKHRYRESEDRHDKNDDAASQRRQPYPYNQYPQYR